MSKDSLHMVSRGLKRSFAAQPRSQVNGGSSIACYCERRE
jgi:hypothetical protein